VWLKYQVLFEILISVCLRENHVPATKHPFLHAILCLLSSLLTGFHMSNKDLLSTTVVTSQHRQTLYIGQCSLIYGSPNDLVSHNH
jgi:hypothetical protein